MNYNIYNLLIYLVIGVVECHLRDCEGDEAEAHEDGADHADDEGQVVPPPDALIEPLAVMVKDVHTLVTHGAVLGPHTADVDITQVTSPVLNNMIELVLVKLRHGSLAVEGQEGRV